MPVTVLNSPIVNRFQQPAFNKATDILAVIGFGIGIIMETVSDIQKYRFKQTHQERGAVCNKGFFAWSRHPNYFAEILIQFCTLYGLRSLLLALTSVQPSSCLQ